MIISKNHQSSFGSFTNHILVTLFNSEEYELRIPVCETGSVKIKKHSSHNEDGGIIDNPLNRFCVTYRYKPESNFSGEDMVELLILKTGNSPEEGFRFERMKIDFYVLD